MPIIDIMTPPARRPRVGTGEPELPLVTGPDDDEFCRRVSEALALGYRLHQGPAVTHDGTTVIVAQALLWPRRSE